MEPERRRALSIQGQDQDNNTALESGNQIPQSTAVATTGTPPAAQHPPRSSSLSPHASEDSSASSGEDTADESFASVITVVPLQRVGRSLWQPPGSPGGAIDPLRASTDSFRSNRRPGLRPHQESASSDPFVDSRSRAGTTGTTGSSTPLLGPTPPARPERAHTVQRGRETRRDLSGGRQSIETTPGRGGDIIRSPTRTTATDSAFHQTSTGTSNSRDIFGSSLAGGAANPTTSLISTFENSNSNLSSPLRSRTDSTIAMKDGQRGPDDLSRLTPGEKQKGVIGSIKRGINNLGSIRGRKSPKTDDDETCDRSGAGSGGDRGSGTPGEGTIKKRKSLAALGDMFGSLKATITPRPRAQAAFELQQFPSEQSMIGGLLLHGPQRLELARGGDGRYAAKDKNRPVYPPRLPLEPRTEPRRGDPNSGSFLSPGPAFSRDDGPAGEVSASRSPRRDRYENKPLPPLPPKNGGDDGGAYEEWKRGGKGGGGKGQGIGQRGIDEETMR